jgi:hypothetical protein
MKIRNESMDSICYSLSFSDRFPLETSHFIIMPPCSEEEAADMFQSDIDEGGMSIYVIRKKVADRNGLDKIKREKIYDTVYVSHSYDELKARGFVVKIRQADFANSPYGVNGDISPW